MIDLSFVENKKAVRETELDANDTVLSLVC